MTALPIDRFTVALVQVASPPQEPVRARRDRVGAMVVDGAHDADLVVLPELWAPGYFAFDHYDERAETLDGPTASAARAWAREIGAFIQLGSVLERAPDGRLHNTALLVDPDGRTIHTYRKIHVFGYRSREAELLTPGCEVGVTPTRLGQIGVTTCYDLRFPELWRMLVDADAEIVITPAAWPAARTEHWQLFTTCRAVEEQIIIIACNAVGEQDGGVMVAGHSRVVDPWGRVLAEAGTDEGVTKATIEPEAVASTRAQFPVLDDRRLGIAAPRHPPG